jgi:hypothetical protein
MSFSTITDLAREIAERLDCTTDDARESLGRNRESFARYEDITDDDVDRLCRVVWNDLRPGDEYPW